MSDRIGSKWSNKEIEFLKDNVNSMSYIELSQILKRTPSAISSKACELKCILRTVGRKNKRKINDIRILDDYCVLLYTDRQNNIFECKFDKSDLDLVKQYYWGVCKSKGVYLRTTVTIEKSKPETIKLHRLLMGNPINCVVDHINGDSLDNRRSNLRVVDSKINAYNKFKTKNTTGVRGLCIKKYNDILYYVAHIRRNNKMLFLKKYPYNEAGFKVAKQDLIEANNFINRNNCLYNPNITCKNEISDYILKREQICTKSENKLYGYRKFCKQIKERDNYICCGCSKDFTNNPSKLHVHHILPKCDYPELSMVEDNCISVCSECHESIKNREYEISDLLKKILRTR